MESISIGTGSWGTFQARMEIGDWKRSRKRCCFGGLGRVLRKGMRLWDLDAVEGLWMWWVFRAALHAHWSKERQRHCLTFANPNSKSRCVKNHTMRPRRRKYGSKGIVVSSKW